MKPRTFKDPDRPGTKDIHRIEVPLDTPQGTYVVILLDADDSFDVVIHYPNNQRECVWSLIKEDLLK